MTALKSLSDNSNVSCHPGVGIHCLSFFFQFENFLVWGMMSDFQLKLG